MSDMSIYAADDILLGAGSTPPAKTPAQLLAEANVSRMGTIRTSAERTGAYYTAAEQDYIDTLVAGAEAGTYSAEDVMNELDRMYVARPMGSSQGSSGDGAPDVTTSNSMTMIRTYLAKFGLETLEDQIGDLMARGITTESAVMYELRETEAFKKRFAANVKRAAAGLPQLQPSTYVQMEDVYREVMKSNGMDKYFNRPELIQSLLEGDVSPQELQARISDGYRRVQEADPATRTQMQRLYNVNDADLAAYFLNPAETMPILNRRAEAAKLAARAMEQGGMELTAASAEELAARGITEQQAMQGFATMSSRSGLYETMTGEESTALSQQEQLGATFGFDPEAEKKLARRIAMRRGEFLGGGRFASTGGATSGTIETGAGMAQ